MQENEPVLIFDLDETILTVNSFSHWVKAMLFGPFGGLNLSEILTLRLQTTQALLERRLMGRSHIETKRILQALWTQALGKDPKQIALEYICARLQRYVRPNMKAVLAAVAQGKIDAILATSAAGEYADAFGRQLGFRHILTTGQTENRREQKRDRVQTMLASLGWSDRPRIFFTDHEEDLPLIQVCERVLWFGSEYKALIIKPQAPEAGITMCATFSDVEIMRYIAVS